MSTTISPLRRITVTLALAGAAAFSAVAIAPSAFAADTVVPMADSAAADSSAPAVTDPAVVADPAAATDPAVVTPPVVAPPVVTPPVVTPPAVVLDKNGKPVKGFKACTDKDLADSAKKVADATKKAAPQLAQAVSLHKAADFLRAQELTMTVAQKNLTELVAKGLDAVGDKVAAQAQASIDKAAILDCTIVSVPGGRF
jgi:hypothetical protein